MDSEQIELFRGMLSHFRKEMLEAIENYVDLIRGREPNALEAPLIVKLPMDYRKWPKTKELKVALDTILDEPIQSQKEIRYALWSSIGSLMMETYPQLQTAPQIDQVHCIIRFSNLPLIADFQFVPFRHPVRLSLSVMECVLHSFSDRSLYVRQSVWYCPRRCAYNQNHIYDGEHSSNNGTSPGKCLACNGDVMEFEDRRSTYVCRFIRVLNAKCVEAPIRYGQICRDVKVKLSDDLCNVKMVLGQTYMLIGTYDILNHTYIAWNFTPNDQKA